MMGNTKSALQPESHRRFPFEPHRGCSHPSRMPATRTDCQGRKHTPFYKTTEKTLKRKVSKSGSRDWIRKTPCRLCVTLFRSSESHREQKGVGIRRQTLSGCKSACNFPRVLETVILKNIPHENRQSRLKIGKQPKRPEDRQSKLTCRVNTTILVLSDFGIKHYGNYRFDVGYFISLQKLLHRKQYLITLNIACS